MMETGSVAETASPTLSARNRMDDLKAYMNTRQVGPWSLGTPSHVRTR